MTATSCTIDNGEVYGLVYGMIELQLQKCTISHFIPNNFYIIKVSLAKNHDYKRFSLSR